MPYITIMQSPTYHQVSFEEIISGSVEVPTMISSNATNTRTYFVGRINPHFLKQFDIDAMIDALETFCKKHKALYDVSRAKLYTTFHIPKKSGGLREINAPVPELMDALRELKTIFETQLFARYHTSAFAYITGRSTIDALKRHQQNESHWFLKTDFSDFFGSTTPEFVRHSLSMIFPFSEVIKYPQGSRALDNALELCFLRGGLPQGTPISPMLTNLMMIPIDHRLCNCLRDYNRNSYVYTRYADDCLISSKKGFSPGEIVGFINKTLHKIFCHAHGHRNRNKRWKKPPRTHDISCLR